MLILVCVSGIDSPRYITVHSVTTSSISLSWPPPDGPEEQPQKFRVEWASCGHSGDNIVEEASYDITNLMPGREYDIRVATIGDNKQLSKFVQTKQYTGESKDCFANVCFLSVWFL